MKQITGQGTREGAGETDDTFDYVVFESEKGYIGVLDKTNGKLYSNQEEVPDSVKRQYDGELKNQVQTNESLSAMAEALSNVKADTDIRDALTEPIR